MLSLFKIIKKNFKLLIRSKSSALIIILGPLLVIFLVGIAFDNLNQFSLSIGTYSEGYSELSESFISRLEAKEYNVQKIGNIERCVEMVRQGKLNTCIEFPENMMIEEGRTNEITFHIDNSKLNLVWIIMNTLSTGAGEQAEELSADLTKDLLDKIDFAKNELYKIRPTVVNVKTENQQSTEDITSGINLLSTNMKDFKEGREAVKNNILGKANGIELVIEEIRDGLDDANITEDEYESVDTRLNEIGTFLYNIRGNFVRQGESEPEWEELTSTLNEVDAGLRDILNSIKANIGSSGIKIEAIQQTVDDVYSELSGIRIAEAATIVNPITTKIEPVATDKSYLNYLFPSLVVLVIMFISILLSNTLVMMEKHSPAYFRNFITPTRDIVFILGSFLTNVLLVFIQLAVILGISAYFFQAQVFSALPQTALILLLTISFFTFVGMIIGYSFSSEETSTLAAISIGSVFLFLSNVILPLETMPDYIRSVARFNPFVLGEDLLRRAIIFQASFSDLQTGLLALAGYSVVLFAVIWILQRIVRKHLFHKFARTKEKAAEKKEK